MNPANAFTAARMASAAVFMFLFFHEGFWPKVAAAAVFFAACFTDYLDGRIARRRGEVTLIGQLMDPIADKILVFSALLSFVEIGILPAWIVLLMLAREIFVTLLRLVGVGRGLVMPAGPEGKIKTVIQIVGIAVVLVWRAAAETPVWNPSWEGSAGNAVVLLFGVVVAVTLVTGVLFTARNWGKFNGVYR